MNLVLNGYHSEPENEEDDYGNYSKFLQPASSPYNIAEKVQQANIDLFSGDTFTNRNKTFQVKFREDLISFEPEILLTDDEVNSLESDPPDATDQILDITDTNTINFNIFDIQEEEEFDEVVEEIEEECDDMIKKLSDENDEIINRIDENVCINANLKKKKVKIRSTKCKSLNNVHVNCRAHCIEKIDFDMSMSIKKLEIHEKPVKCPLLKLQNRKCCDQYKERNPTNLPTYNGFRSEYGLSSEELQKRDKRKQKIKLKEQKRQKLLQEYENRKNQQNEAVFCQWLKDVARRKVQRQKIETPTNSMKQCISPNVINFPTKVAEKHNEIRPKTANGFVPKQNIKKVKRPHTSSCVFIEVPQKLLEEGIHIGDLLVTNSSVASKKMHIVTVS